MTLTPVPPAIWKTNKQSSELTMDGYWNYMQSISSALTWATAYRIVLTPIRVEKITTVKRLAYQGGAGTSNMDIGLYDINRKLLTSTGSAAKNNNSGNTTIVDVADVTIGPGTYYIAMCNESASDTYGCSNDSTPLGTAKGIIVSSNAVYARHMYSKSDSNDASIFTYPGKIELKANRLYLISVMNSHGTSASTASVYTSPIFARSIDAVADTTDTTTYTSNTIRMKAGRLYTLSITNGKASNADAVSSITGGGTWTSRVTSQFDTSNIARASLFTCVPTADYIGTVSITFGATQTGAVFSINEFQNVDTATNDGIVQTATGTGTSTSPLATLGTFGSTRNATFGQVSTSGTAGAITTKNGFSNLSHTISSVPTISTDSFFSGHNDTAVSETIGSAPWYTIAAELKSLNLDQTFTSRSTTQYNSNLNRVSVFSVVPTTDYFGPITIDFSGTTQTSMVYHVIEFLNVDTASNDGIVQQVTNTGSDTTPTVTLSAFGSTNNATFSAIGEGSSSAITPGTGFTELAEWTVSNPSGALHNQFRYDNDTIIDATIALTNTWGICGMELKGLYTPSVVLPSSLPDFVHEDALFQNYYVALLRID